MNTGFELMNEKGTMTVGQETAIKLWNEARSNHERWSLPGDKYREENGINLKKLDNLQQECAKLMLKLCPMPAEKDLPFDSYRNKERESVTFARLEREMPGLEVADIVPDEEEIHWHNERKWMAHCVGCFYFDLKLTDKIDPEKEPWI